MDLAESANSIEKAPVKVNYDGCHSTEKQKQARHTEVLSSLDAGKRTAPNSGVCTRMG
jgi:hypothetical protein